MSSPRRNIEFGACDGIILRGWLYPRLEASPCIIMTHGLGGTRHFLLPDFATTFHEAGYVVLLYDNRNWGDSDGLPRQESNPTLQQADYYDAFNFATTLDCVDDTKIVYWGSSFSGGNVIHAAAVDKRIKAAIIQCPAVSGETRSIAFKDRIPAVLEDRKQIAAGTGVPTVPIIAENRTSAHPTKTTAMFPTQDAYDILVRQKDCGSRWENFITTQTQLHMMTFEGQAFIQRISPTPLLFVVPGNDVLVTTASQMAAFEKAREPKQLLVLEGCGHFDVYVGDHFKKNIQAQLEFLEKYVK